MKNVRIKNLSLVNFKGHKDLSVDFSEMTFISGDNATGKSTIVDAFFWLLYGKDQFNRTDYEITPYQDDKKLDKVDSEVSAILSVDEKEISIKRVYHQKWQRPRGQAIEVFKGCETLCFFNDVPLKMGEYKERIDLILDETVFKLITSPSEFLYLHWTKQREFLFNLAGTVSNAEILDSISTVNNKEAVDSITAMLNSGKALIDYKKEIAAKKKKLKDELDEIQPRIDQTTRLMPEAKDYSEFEASLSDIDAKIADVNKTMSDRSSAIKSKYDDVQKKQGLVSDIKTKQQALRSRLEQDAIQEATEANQAITLKQSEVKSLKTKIESAQKDLNHYNAKVTSLGNDIAAIEAKQQKLRNEWRAEGEKKYNENDECLYCPIFGTKCSDVQATSKHQEVKEKAKQAFYEDVKAKQDAINVKGKALGSELVLLNENKVKNEQNAADAKAEVFKLQSILDNTNRFLLENKPAEPIPVTLEANEEYIALQQQIDQIQATIEVVKPVDNADLTIMLNDLNSKRDEVKKVLGEKDTINTCKKEVERLTDKGRDIAQQIADIEQTEFIIDNFNKVKINECEKRINSRFDIAKFKLFDKTNEGNEFECCIATNKEGVPISATNTAEKINAGLDIITALSLFYNIKAPIFCDGAESVNHYIKAGSQMIFLKVTSDSKLKIENL